MPKRKLRVEFRIPLYVTPRAEWRKAINRFAAEAVETAGVEYGPDDHLELDVRIYHTEPALAMHDVDNRLKDIMDALQGHVQGTGKKGRALPALIPNDSQVFKVTVEKQYPPGQSHGPGHVTIRRYNPKRQRGR